MNEQNNNGNNRGNQGDNRQQNGGIDFAAMFNNVLNAGNRRRLVLRHRGETVLRLPLTIVAVIALILLWQSAFLLVALVALVFFLQVQVSFERRSDLSQETPYRD